jgi:hypothetical protein
MVVVVLQTIPRKGKAIDISYLATRYITSTYVFLTYPLAHSTLSSYYEKIAVCHHHRTHECPHR